MSEPTDHDLLGDYAARGSADAFAELVWRHLDLVYAAALRRVRDAHLGEDRSALPSSTGSSGRA
jgi:hypothetical protein